MNNLTDEQIDFVLKRRDERDETVRRLRYERDMLKYVLGALENAATKKPLDR